MTFIPYQAERPPEYDQPRHGMDSITCGQKETVGYVADSSIRIWFNHLPDEFPTHWHKDIEIVVGLYGYYEVVVDDHLYKIDKGDIIIIPPGTLHTLTPKGQCNGFVYLIDVDVLNSIHSATSIDHIFKAPIFIEQSDNPNLAASAWAILRQMRDDYFSSNTMWELLVYSHLLKLVAEIGYHYSATSRNAQHFRADKRKEYVNKFNEIINYISTNCTKDLCLEQVAYDFGFSKFHFSRLFRRYTDLTFCEYLNSQRIKLAEQLMSEDDLSITEISFQCGFPSLSTFSRIFKQKKKCTPSEYRKLYSKKY